jgi:hypothetical protein
MPELPPTDSVSLDCSGESQPILFRIRFAGGEDVTMPCGVYPATRVTVSRGGYGVAITLEVDSSNGLPSGSVPH